MDDTEAGMKARAALHRLPLPPRPSPPPADTGDIDAGPTPTQRALHFPAWIPFALSIAALVINQVAVAVHALPASEPVAVSLIILAALASVIAGVQVLIVQYQAGQAALMRLRADLLKRIQ